ncbi:MAG: hypothetical protein HZA53_15630 [Planctomycetes bacterium]|nr:hypothetical protein [Planctomycetota bacterium]
MKTSRVVTGLVVLALALGVTIVLQVAGRKGGTDATNDPGAPAPKEPALALQAPLELAPERPQTTGRESVSPSLLVLDANKIPLPNATVGWLAVEDEQIDELARWPNVEWARFDERAVTGTTGTDGTVRLALSESAKRSRRWFLWAWHARYVGSFVFGETKGEAVELPSELVLGAPASLEVTVLGRDGLPAEGATVTQLLDARRDDLTRSNGTAALTRRLVHRSAKTDAQGRAVLTPWPGVQLVSAILGDRRSDVWSGKASAKIKLSLEPTFQLSGNVAVEAGARPDTNSGVRWLIQREGDQTFIDRLAVRADGTFGPVALPVLQAQTYFYQLEGAGLALTQIEKPVPAPGDRIQLEFRPEGGVEVPVRVVDEQGQGIPNAVVQANWAIEGAWRRIERTTNDEGVALFGSLARTKVWFRARASGHSSRLLDPIDVGSPLPTPIVITLAPGGRLAGRCTHDGKPVRDFTLQFWPESANQYTRLQFADREDGTFEVDEAPLGTTTLVAMSRDYPSPPPAQVEITAGGTANQDLVFPKALTGKGQVVDAVTLDPVLSARLRVWASTPSKKLVPRGEDHATGASGRFELSAFGPGSNWVDFEAPGYASRSVEIHGGPASPFEVPLVRLFRKRALEIRLTSNGAITDYSVFQLHLQRGTYNDQRRFPTSGVVRYESMDPGQYDVNVWDVDGSGSFEIVAVQSSEDYTLEIPVRSNKLIVDVIPEAGLDIPPRSSVSASWMTNGSDVHTRTIQLFVDRPIEFLALPPGRTALLARDPDGMLLGVADAVVTGKGDDRCRMALANTEKRIRIKDRKGDPVAGAEAILVGQEGTFDHVLVTNDQGECTLRTLSVTGVSVSIVDTEGGFVPCQAVDVSANDSKVIEVIFDPSHVLAARLLERGHPVNGLEVFAQDACRIAFQALGRNTNESGLVTWGPVGTGEYRILVRQPGWWPIEAPIQLTSDAPTDVEVRRLGSLDVTVVSPLGRSIEGARVDLRSIEMDTTVAAWAAGGRVPAPAGGLVTNAQGKLRVNGLPNGKYAWRVFAPSGGELSGEVDVPPQAVGALEVHSDP